MQNIPGFGAPNRDSRLEVRSAVRTQRPGDLNALTALKMKGSAINLQNQEQMLKTKKQEEASMRKAKKYFAQQKIADGRLQAARQMMHEESHEADQSYEEEDSRNYSRQNRFNGKNPQSRTSNILQEIEHDPNDTYQDIDDDEESADNMESRAEYNSEEDEGETNFKQMREARINQPGGSRTHKAG